MCHQIPTPCRGFAYVICFFHIPLPTQPPSAEKVEPIDVCDSVGHMDAVRFHPTRDRGDIGYCACLRRAGGEERYRVVTTGSGCDQNGFISSHPAVRDIARLTSFIIYFHKKKN